jgi:hypothetical protein
MDMQHNAIILCVLLGMFWMFLGTVEQKEQAVSLDARGLWRLFLLFPQNTKKLRQNWAAHIAI